MLALRMREPFLWLAIAARRAEVLDLFPRLVLPGRDALAAHVHPPPAAVAADPLEALKQQPQCRNDARMMTKL